MDCGDDYTTQQNCHTSLSYALTMCDLLKCLELEVQEIDSGGTGRPISEFEACLVYKVSSRTARAIPRNPVSKNRKKKKKKKNQNQTKTKQPNKSSEQPFEVGRPPGPSLLYCTESSVPMPL
jgi:hypothetical protein